MVSVRTIIMSDQSIFKFTSGEDEQNCKPTLLMIHGFGGSAALLYPVYKQLLEHFRIVAIDMLGFGASSRVTLSEAVLSSASACENYHVRWLSRWLYEMTLNQEMPDKFYLSGHSYGGFISSLFACAHPDRISALFLNSAIGAEPEPAEYDPMNIRLSSNDTGPQPEILQRFWLSEWEKKRTPLDIARMLPDFILDRVQDKIIRGDYAGYPARHMEIIRRYYSAQFKLGSSGTERTITASFKFGCYAHHRLTEADRLGDPNLPFPVAFCYGDQDWLGTEGADTIVQGN